MKKIRQITAWITIVVIVGLVIGTVVCAVTGSRYFFGMLFLMIVVPVVLWVFMWFTHLIHGDSSVISKEDMKALEEKKQSLTGDSEE
ncbi:MAG: hypothetical protein ACI4A3_11855 [Lachnospiraceae bacterium]